MIPIQEAIDTGAWLRGEFVEQSEDDRVITFQIKLKEFSKIDSTDFKFKEIIFRFMMNGN